MKTHLALVQFSGALGFLAHLDPSSGLAKKMNDKVIGQLYDTIPHPPASYLGPANWFRQADGGGNNLENPDIGRGGRPYARSVQGRAGLPRSSLPDPGLVFDSLLRRKEVRSVGLRLFLVCLRKLIIQTRNHLGGMSSLIFAFATIVTHSLFHTDIDPEKPKDACNNKASYPKRPQDIYINKASSYLDLSPVYGEGALFASV